MVTEAKYLASSVSGNVTTPANALGAPDGVVTGDANQNINWTHRWRFQAHSAGVYAVNQVFTFRWRKGSNSGNPQIANLSIYRNGVLLQDIVGSTITVTQTTLTDVARTLTLGNQIQNGDTIDVEINQISAGGSPSARNAVAVDSVTWTADFTPPATTFTRTATLESILKKTQQVTAQAQGTLQKVGTLQSVSALSALANRLELSFTSDSQLQARLLKTFDAEGLMQKQLSQTLQANAGLVQRFTATLIAETLLSKQFVESLEATALLQGSSGEFIVANTALQKALAQMLSATGVIATRPTVGFETSALLSSSIVAAFQATAALALLNITTSVTAVGLLSDKTVRTRDIDASGVLGLGTLFVLTETGGVLQKETEILLAAASALRDTFTPSVDASGSIGYQRTLPFGLDIVVYETFLRIFTADAPLMKVGLQPLELRGTVQQTLFASIEAVGRIVNRRLLTLETESALQKRGFINLGITTYLKHVVACWQSPEAQAETWVAHEVKQTAWTTSDNKVSTWNSEEESPNGCDSTNS